MHLRQGGPSEVFKENGSPLYLSTHNYVHVLTPMQLSNTIGVECFTRKINYKTDEVKYDCLIWPRQRQGYHHAQATFRFPVSFTVLFLFKLIVTPISPCVNRTSQTGRHSAISTALSPARSTLSQMTCDTGVLASSSFRPTKILLR